MDGVKINIKLFLVIFGGAFISWRSVLQQFLLIYYRTHVPMYKQSFEYHAMSSEARGYTEYHHMKQCSKCAYTHLIYVSLYYVCITI